MTTETYITLWINRWESTSKTR